MLKVNRSFLCGAAMVLVATLTICGIQLGAKPTGAALAGMKVACTTLVIVTILAMVSTAVNAIRSDIAPKLDAVKADLSKLLESQTGAVLSTGAGTNPRYKYFQPADIANLLDPIESLIQAKSLNAPRVTPSDLAANIVHTEIVRHVAPSGQVLRWAVLTTRNGFAVAGKPSASASPENDDAEIGEKVAIENAREELWPLMGYELRSQLAKPVLTEGDALADLNGKRRPDNHVSNP